MARIATTEPAIYDAVEHESVRPHRAEPGPAPNSIAVLSLSLPLTRAVLAFGDVFERGSLHGRVAEQLATTVSKEDRCSAKQRNVLSSTNCALID